MFFNYYNLIVFVKLMFWITVIQVILRYISREISCYFIFAELATILYFKEADDLFIVILLDQHKASGSVA